MALVKGRVAPYQQRTLKNRLAPFQEQIVKEAQEHGRYYAFCLAQKLAGVRDILCFDRWLAQVTGDEGFGLCPANPVETAPTPAQLTGELQRVFSAYASNLAGIVRLTAENKRFVGQARSLLVKISENKPLLLEDVVSPRTEAVKDSRSEVGDFILDGVCAEKQNRVWGVSHKTPHGRKLKGLVFD